VWFDEVQFQKVYERRRVFFRSLCGVEPFWTSLNGFYKYVTKPKSVSENIYGSDEFMNVADDLSSKPSDVIARTTIHEDLIASD
jgi:hypothetical protein